LTVEEVRAAARLLAGQVVRTPCLPAPALSELLGAELWVKYENLQATGSFKARGALVKLLGLDGEARRRGVIAVSAGNHAQGVALHARRLGIPATIVMPAGTPHVKVRQTAAYGAEVVLWGETLSEAAERADALMAARGLVFVHPYDDPAIVAGQGTVGLEMLEDVPDLDVLLVPVGGGGLIGGVAVAARALKPSIRIVGVETEAFPSMRQALAGENVVCGGQTIADGIAVKQPGKLTLELARQLVDEVVLVSESALERAIDLYLECAKTVAEGAGAAGLAALLEQPGRYAGRRVGLVLSGGNIDPRMLASHLMRGLVRDGRICSLRVEIPDRPGVLAKVARVIGEAEGNILEVNHQRLFPEVPAKLTDLDVMVETRDAPHVEELLRRLAEAGFPSRLLTHDPRRDRG